MTTAYITIALSAATLTLLSAVGFFLLITLLLVAVLLVAKHYLVRTGVVRITINDDKTVEGLSGSTLLSSLANSKGFLSSHAAARAAAASAECRCSRAAARFSPPRPYTSPARRSRTTGASAARSRSRKT